MTTRHESRKARTAAKVEVPFMFAVPSREARLGGWAAWERHMLRLNRQHILCIKTGEFIILTNEDVFTMPRDRIEALAAQALAVGPPSFSHWTRLKEWVRGTWRFYAGRVRLA